MSNSNVHGWIFASLTYTALLAQTPPPPPVPPVRPAQPAIVQGGGQSVGQGRDAQSQTQRPPVVGTSSIAGIIVNERGQAIKGARVSLSGGVVGRNVTTDSSGAYLFDKLPAGRYSVNANRTRYLSGSYGQKRPGRSGTQIQLEDGEQKKNLSVTLFGASVITGVVYGDDGEPMQNANVRAMKYTYQNGIKRLGEAAGAQSDDRGVFRLFGLTPGDYIVAAVPQNDFSSGGLTVEMAVRLEEALATARAAGRDASYQISNGTLTLPGGQVVEQPSPVMLAQTFYPGTSQPASAMVLTIGAGEERQGIDISLVKAQTATISGTVLAASLPEGAGITVMVQPADEAARGAFGSSSRVMADGRFTIRNVPPGQYYVIARASVQVRQQLPAGFSATGGSSGMQSISVTQTTLTGRVLVTVDGQPLDNIMVSLDGGHAVQGRVVFEGGVPPDLTRVRVTANLSMAPGANLLGVSTPPPVQVSSDGTFKFAGVAPGNYTVRVSGIQNYSMKSSIIEGRDSLDFPFEMKDTDIAGAVVTLAANVTPTELSGTITDQLSAPAVDFTIIVFSADQRFWTPGSRRVSTSRPGTDGKFSFRGLPPGDYRVAALADLEPGTQYDPAFLRALLGASTTITLGEGAKVTQDLRISAQHPPHQ